MYKKSILALNQEVGSDALVKSYFIEREITWNSVDSLHTKIESVEGVTR